MAGRHREELMANQTDSYAFTCKYSGTNGSCTVNPGAPTVIFGTWSGSGTSSVEYEFREMDDVVTPEFEKGVALGKIFNNPMTSTFERFYKPILTVSMSYMLQLYGCTPPRFYNWREFVLTGDRSIDSLLGANLWKPVTSIDVTSLKDQAIASAWSRIDQSEMLFLASIKEAGQTVDGLIYILKKVYKIFRALRRADIKSLAGELSPTELREIYLNARYNLRPLMYDIKGITAVLNAQVSSAQRQTFRRNLSQSEVSNDTGTSQVIHDAYRDWTVSYSRSVNQKVSVRAGVLTNVEPTSKAQLLGLDRIMETVWDLIPFSFIVDWFCNAGDIVGAWSPNMGITALASWVHVTRVTEFKTTILGSNFECLNTGTYHHTNPISSVGGGTATRYLIEKERIPDYSRPIFPSFRVNLDPLKLLDLGLIIGSLKKFKFRSQ